jgi:alcohol dehydrogenase (NADP+)
MRMLKLRDGASLPALGLGTWKSDAGLVAQAVRTAIRAGYRHIDCAPVYGNEVEVGEVARDALWVTSKLWNDSHAAAAVIPALKATLTDLGLDYLDLFLIHWPVAQRRGIAIPGKAGDMVPLAQTPLIETWEAMEAAVTAGLVRHIGVSNFSQRKLIELSALTAHPPEVNQVELHPYLQQASLLDYCHDAGIVVTAYSPLGSRDRNPALKAADEPDVLADAVITDIAAELNATPAQVLIAWALKRGTAVIPKSVTTARIRENFAASAIKLSADHGERIASLDRHRRLVTGGLFALPGSPYTYENVWDEAPQP